MYRNSNVSVNLNQKIPTLFYNVKNYNSHLIIQELGKLNLKIDIIPNELEEHMHEL